MNSLEAGKEKIAKQAMYICSKPDCLRSTGYDTTKGEPRTIAEAAHINPADKKGPRFDETVLRLPKVKENGIWLCRICHTIIDEDPDRYPARGP